MSGALPQTVAKQKRHWHVHIRRRDRALRQSDHYWTNSFRAVMRILQTYGAEGSNIQSAEFHLVYTCDGKVHETREWGFIEYDSESAKDD